MLTKNSSIILFLRKILIKGRYLLYLPYSYVAENAISYWNGKFDCFNYKYMIFPHPIYPIGAANRTYGNKYLFLETKERNDELIRIEHGIYFGQRILETDVAPSVQKVLTYGQYRFNVLEKYRIETHRSYTIDMKGPYILYAHNFMGKSRLDSLKEKLGRILLVFPSHSSKFIDPIYEEDRFYSEIERLQQSYDTVVICMYWKDIIMNREKPYLNKGYMIACAGYAYDKHFYCRLRDIIDLSTMTMSNCLGSHIGYCIAMNKPHYFYYMPISYVENGRKMDFGKREQIMQEEIDEIAKVFSSTDEAISSDQRRIVEYYWGKSSIR